MPVARPIPQPIDDEDLSPSQRFLRWWRTRWGVATGVFLVLLVVGVWKGRDAYGAAKVWRAEGLIAKSEAADARGDDRAAEEYLRRAGALLIRHPVMLRAVARHQARRYDPACLELFEALAKARVITGDDWIGFTRVALRHGQPARIERGLQELRRDAALADSPAVGRLRAEERARSGEWSEALGLARRAAAGASPGADERLFLARLLLRLPSAVVPESGAPAAEAITLLGQVAQSPDRLGLEALEELAALPRHPEGLAAVRAPEVVRWISAAGANPFASEELRTRMWTLRLATDAPRRAAVVEEFEQHFAPAPLPARLAAVRWLNQHGEFARAKRISAAVKMQSGDWFMAYLDSAAGLGEWDSVLQEVETEASIPLAAAIRRLFRLRAQIELGRKPDVQFEWNLIRLALKPGDLAQQMYVAGYVEQIGFPEAAAQTYRQILDEQRPVTPDAPPAVATRRLQCYLGFFRSAAGSMPTPELAQVMAQFAAEFPELDEAQNDAAYLRLLVGTATEADEQMIRRLLERKPALLAYRTTAALAELRAQRFAEALALYRGWTIDWAAAPDRYRAVYSAVLVANGREAEAGVIRAGLLADGLREEEKNLAAVVGQKP